MCVCVCVCVCVCSSDTCGGDSESDVFACICGHLSEHLCNTGMSLLLGEDKASHVIVARSW